ncbi:MAG: type IV toxin-antitoxin system AbiEi family antitoxin [Gallionella sp.]|nr:type IV toxin-antitoxin system AbiEi family antitoxin [Gallionella sp.]
MNTLNDKEQAILLHALEALQRTTGFIGNVIEREPIIAQGFHADVHVEIEANGQCYGYMAEIKRIDRFATLADIKNQYARYGDHLLLVAPRVTTELAEKCRELDLQFIDTAGNAYLHGLGLFVLVKGQRLIEGEDIQLAEQQGKRTGTATNLRAFFALLCKPELLNAPYRDINQAAGVALGTVGWVFFDLNARGYITGGKGKGDRVLLERLRLVQEWVTNYPIKLRPKLNPRRFRAPKTDWWKEVDITKYGAQWGAEVAAEKMTGYLRPHTLTIYLHKEQGQKNLTRMVAEHKLRADLQGDIEILDAFWDFEDEKPMPETVPPLLAYADLIATLDPRNLEAAKLIYERYLATNDTEA